MVIWKDIGVRIFHKIPHIKKIGGKDFNSFCLDYGDVPVARWNEITQKIEPVVNPRGRAYAARRRASYRQKVQGLCQTR